MMGKIDDIISMLGKQNTEIALIKQTNSQTEEHLKFINGKVQAHESRLQITEGSVAINSKTLVGLIDAGRESKTFWQENWKVVFGGIITLLVAYILKLK